MIHLLALLVATSSTSCEDISDKIQRARDSDLSPESKEEVIELFKYDLPEVIGIECDWDAKAD
tara:strand:- start:446 stop:634 length:189 start_codon:yes stop_codon:yes gene_type:complete